MLNDGWETAAEVVKRNGCWVGTGSTLYLVESIGKRVEKGLTITG